MKEKLKLKRKVILIFGRTGSGKSTLVKKIIKDYNRIFIIDKLFEYTDGIIFETFLDLQNYFIKQNPKQFKCICRFTTDIDIENLFKLVWIVGNCIIVVEESELYINPYSKFSNFLKLVRYGRHKNINIIAIARRVVELSNDIKANADYIITFKQILDRDLNYLASLGFNKEKCFNLEPFKFEVIRY